MKTNEIKCGLKILFTSQSPSKILEVFDERGYNRKSVIENVVKIEILSVFPTNGDFYKSKITFLDGNEAIHVVCNTEITRACLHYTHKVS
jgi:hypothetical protein